MDVILQHISGYRHRLLVVGILVISTLASLGLLFLRWAVVGYPMYGFLVWDLFLAWVPFWISSGIYVLHARGSRNRSLLLSSGFVWLLFYPNAPYLLTEFVHLTRVHNGLWWFDLLMVFGFAWNGLMLGLLSLYTIQQVVCARIGERAGWRMALIVLTLAGCGVALGRFQRFNSWDIVRHPVRLVTGLAGDLLHPEAARTGLMMAIVLGGFLLLAYLSFWAIVTLNQDIAFRQPTPRPRSRLSARSHPLFRNIPSGQS